MTLKFWHSWSFTLLVFLISSATAYSAEDELLGRWNLTVQGVDGTYPSWLEIRKSGYSTLVGSYVGQFGSARPIAHIKKTDDTFHFTVPPQWEKRDNDVTHRFKIRGDTLSGETTDDNGNTIHWTAERAPSLNRTDEPKWGEPIELFNGQNLDGWKTQLPGVANGWVVVDKLLSNRIPGNNLVSEQEFNDFKLSAEFRYPAGSNSGLYLRGRYEVQIEDNFGGEAESHKIGGVYGHLTPSSNASKPAGQWQTYEITLIGRTITVILNGKRIIDRQVIPGITGGAIDSREGEPGPILIQGDHGPVEFRRLTLIPAVEK